MTLQSVANRLVFLKKEGEPDDETGEGEGTADEARTNEEKKRGGKEGKPGAFKPTGKGKGRGREGREREWRGEGARRVGGGGRGNNTPEQDQPAKKQVRAFASAFRGSQFTVWGQAVVWVDWGVVGTGWRLGRLVTRDCFGDLGLDSGLVRLDWDWNGARLGGMAWNLNED